MYILLCSASLYIYTDVFYSLKRMSLCSLRITNISCEYIDVPALNMDILCIEAYKITNDGLLLETLQR